MATSFINVTSTDVGTADAVVYTVPAGLKAILIGCNVANKSGGILPVSLILRKSEMFTSPKISVLLMVKVMSL
jgi:hypothetical protein